MAKSAVILIRHSPYGLTQAAEGLRHLLGALSNGFQTIGVLVDDGVYVAKSGQQGPEAGFTSLAATLAQGLKQAGGARILVEKESLATRGLESSDLIPGLEIIAAAELADLLREAPNLMIF
ncbi:DsrE family protein [Moorella naiadis]|uniref:DsrE family protein n=1 Tax=Moorella naiadis (nom. illeg.) TaxID=3093670 RepID=UPI003D9C8463